MSSDHTQNQLILLKHHILDAQEAVDTLQGDKSALNAALEDMLSIVLELAKPLPAPLEKEVQQIKEKTFKDLFNNT